MESDLLSDGHVRILNAALARNATRAERACLHWMLQRYWRRTCRLLARVLDDPADTDAVAEETFARAWKSVTAVRRSPLAFERRLLRLAIEIAESRSSARPGDIRRGFHVVAEERLDRGADPAGGENTSSPGTLEHSISELPLAQRAAVVLHDVEGLASDDAAEVMSVALLVFRRNLHAGRMALVSGLAADMSRFVEDEALAGDDPRAAEGVSPVIR